MKDENGNMKGRNEELITKRKILELTLQGLYNERRPYQDNVRLINMDIKEIKEQLKELDS